MLTFPELFVGGEQTYGSWTEAEGGITHPGPATEALYQAHLDGRVGLGLVPVRLDGTCRFAAIDIDDTNVHHPDLYLKIKSRHMPLTVCRSKSGGAHLYLFMKEPGVRASQVMPLLRRWAVVLGYPRAEVFPKQPKITKENLGSWINLPYFAHERTVRYALGAEGALTLDEFLDQVEFYSGLELVDESVAESTSAQRPPCLVQLTTGGVPDGHRNQVLFNLGVFYRKSAPETWEQQLREYNQTDVHPPLPGREISTIIRSVGRTRYQYTCNQEPLTSCCNRPDCLRLPFGVANMPWQEGTYDELTPGHLRKMLTDPPRYILEVNGRDTELTWDELFDHKLLRKRLSQLYDLVLPPMKADRWEGIVKQLLQTKQDIPAPKDASGRGLLFQRCLEFLAVAERTRGIEDLLRGLPVMNGDKVLFRVGDLQKFLASLKQERVDIQTLFQLIYVEGGDSVEMEIKGKKVSVWRLPKNCLNLQTEDFTPPQEREGKKGDLF